MQNIKHRFEVRDIQMTMLLIFLSTTLAILTASCALGDVDTETASPQTPSTSVNHPGANPDYRRFAEVEGIVDPTNFSWPRTVRTSEGEITIDAAPSKAHALSLGHAEIMLAIADPDRLAASYSFYSDPTISNIVDEVAAIAEIGSDPEEAVALEPQLAIASRYTDPDLIAVLKSAGIPVMRAALENSARGNIPNILLMAYALGEEERGIALANEIEQRLSKVASIIEGAPVEPHQKPRVLMASQYLTDVWVAGRGSTEDGIVEAAGGRNTAAEAGVQSNAQSSIEGIAAMNPDVIIIAQPQESGAEFVKLLKSSGALAEAPAIANNDIHIVPARYFTTLSHWNVRGIETLAQVLHPELFSDIEFKDFFSPSPSPSH